MTKVIIVDLDGTLADITHRLHLIKGELKDWRSFFLSVPHDEPIREIIDIVNALYYTGRYKIHIVTERNASSERDTLLWLDKHGIQYHAISMRSEGDRRSDIEVKTDIVRQHYDLFNGEIAMMLEDRKRVVDHFRKFGIRVLQVGPGEF